MGLLLLVSFFWGMTFPLIKDALAFISPVLLLSLRFFLSALLMVPLLAKKKKKLFSGGHLKHGLLAGALLFVGYYTQTVGLQYTTAAKSGIITGTYVVLIPLISYVYLRSRVSRMDAIASVLAFSGLVVMSAGSLSSRTVQLGDLLTFACAFGYAFQIAYVSRHSRDLDSAVFTFYQILAVAILSTLAVPFYPLPMAGFTPYVVFTILFTAIFGGALAYYITTRALIFVEPTTAGIIFVAEPIFAALCSMVINREALGVFTAVGGSVVVFAMFLTSLDKYLRAKRLCSPPGNDRHPSAARS